MSPKVLVLPENLVPTTIHIVPGSRLGQTVEIQKASKVLEEALQDISISAQGIVSLYVGSY
jgi:hypothetical protein